LGFLFAVVFEGNPDLRTISDDFAVLKMHIEFLDFGNA